MNRFFIISLKQWVNTLLWENKWGNYATLLLGLNLLLIGTAQAQVSLSLSTNANYGAGNSAANMPICSPFTYDLNYGVISPTTAATNAVINLPLKGMQYVSIGSNPHIQSAMVVGTAPNDTLRIRFVNPLAAGASGTASVVLRFICGNTCNGYIADLTPVFTASNASNSPLSGPTTSVTANAVINTTSMNLQLNSFLVDDGMGNGVGSYSLGLDYTFSSNRYYLNKNIATLTLPAGATLNSCGDINGSPITCSQSGNVVTWFAPNGINLTGPSGYRIDNVRINYPQSSFPANTSFSLTYGNVGVWGNNCAPYTNSVIRNYSIPSANSVGSCNFNADLYGNFFEGINFIGRAGHTFGNAGNYGNTPLTNFTITQTLPSNFIQVSSMSASGSGIGVTNPITYYYKTNLSTGYILLGSVTTANQTINIPVLGAGEYITHTRYTIALLSPGGILTPQTNYSILSTPRDGSLYVPVTIPQARSNGGDCFISGATCMTITHTLTGEYPVGNVLNLSACSGNAHVVNPVALITNFEKQVVGNTSIGPGGTATYSFRIKAQGADSTRNLEIVDVLPASLSFNGFISAIYENNTAVAQPTVTQSGQTVTFSWAGKPLAPTSLAIVINFSVRAKSFAAPGPITNCASVSASNAVILGGTACNSQLTITSLANMDAIKWVRGELDQVYTKYPDVGLTSKGGDADYRLVLVNTGNVVLKDINLIDILPWIGDQAVSANFARLSEWHPDLELPLQFYPPSAANPSLLNVMPLGSAPAGAQVFYSTETNPCRVELSPAYNPAGCTGPAWSTTPPTPISSTAALKLLIPGPFNPSDTIVIGMNLKAPISTQVDKVAWNSFAYQATRNDNNVQLPIAEPNKVGIRVQCPSITNPITTRNFCQGTTGGNLTVQTNQSLPNSIKFVRFTSDQTAVNGSETATELSNIYSGGTALATVSPSGPTGGPYTATLLAAAGGWSSLAPGTYYVYALLEPDQGATCRPVQEIIVHITQLSITGVNATCQPGDNGKYDLTVNLAYQNSPGGTITVTLGAGQTGVSTATTLYANGTATVTISGLTNTGLSNLPVSAAFTTSTVCAATAQYNAPTECCPAPFSLCAGESYTLTAEAGYTNYQWFLDTGSGPVAIPGANSAVYATANQVGTYTWTAQNISNCVVPGCCPVMLVAGTCTDYGDLPDSGAGVSSNNYETLSGSNGPSHTIVPGLFMGTTVDIETNGQPNAAATGDGSDEDGVTFPVFVPGQSAVVTVTATNSTGANAFIYGFIDWNGDGDFNDVGEIAFPATVATGSAGTTFSLVFPVPANALAGAQVGARFRLTTQSGMGANGPSANGEVEDYLVLVGCVPPTLSTANATVCPGNIVRLSNLVTNNSPAGTLTFHTTQTDANNGANPLVNENIIPVGTVTYYVRSVVTGSCASTAAITITVSLPPALAVVNGSICAGGNINLSTLVTNSGGGTLSYHTTPTDAATGTNPLLNNSVSPVTATNYYIRSVNASGCYSVREVVVSIQPTVCAGIQISGPN